MQRVDDGVDICLHAGHANRVDICFFDRRGNEWHERRFQLHRALHGNWHGHVAGIDAGQAYGFRVYGRWDPDAGMRHNPAKVLLDPYARAFAQNPQLHQAIFSHQVDENFAPLPGNLACTLDSAPYCALGMVTHEAHHPIRRPHVPWDQTVIYEAHVVGLTRCLPDIPAHLRGTYAGVAHPETIRYLKGLGITTIELLPIQAKFSEPFLTRKGLENYWGYNTLSYFAPEPSYATEANRNAGPSGVIDEVKGMVSLLHDAGIEVILDVVYNHTCEAGVDGPTLSWRGIDSTAYYRHDSRQPGRFKDTTGCGNSFDFRRQAVVQLTLDSLRYWVECIGVDGFRFDLAPTLSREGDTFNRNHPLYVAMATDPVLRSVKLINEPWDLGINGWQTGNFPSPTADWNDRFRDSLRSFWLCEPAAIHAGGQGCDLRDIATRLSGSADLFGHGRIPGGRGIHSSINFVTAHDGFTVRDLVSYNEKHNEANLEDNRDGTTNNLSWNHGSEGDDGVSATSEIAVARRRSIRNLLGTLLLSAGTPMINAGDESLRTQRGNNNAYCQNSDISWMDWEITGDSRNLYETVSYLNSLRREHQVLRPTAFYTGEVSENDSIRDLEWFDATGTSMADYKWFDTNIRTLQMLRSGKGEDVDALMVINGSIDDVHVTSPHGRGQSYELVWDSVWESPNEAHCAASFAAESTALMPWLSMRLYFSTSQSS
ncbi:glycogen debranching enzyme GlgX [Arcanobacterium bovis]|uniref:Glycogen debranching enzyme GlgX n=1 Tax=Arcanobacterium bovis TaxID=2529275 RepID=A0A4V2KR95_9ACTO|nr:glycogen debranching enzyme GlgX [Arcanobacterium bovis]